MGKAEYRSALRSKKLINDALADLLEEKPLEKITVTDVVNRADINRGTFYAHYRDIPDVVDHLIQQTFSAISEALSQPMDPSASVGHILVTQIQCLLEEDLSFYRKVLNSSASALMQKQLVETTTDFFLQNKARFWPEEQPDFELMIRFCAGGLSNLYRDWFAGKLHCTLSELTQRAEHLMDRLIRIQLPQSGS